MAKRKQNLKALGRKIRISASQAPQLAQDKAREAQDACMAEADEYAATLTHIWGLAGFQILDTAQPSHVAVARRAISRTRPFNDQGGGYRDTLHWLTLLNLAEDNPYEPFVFLSGDRIFATKAGLLLSDLVNEFSSVNKASILLRTDLDLLEVPGHYTTDPVQTQDYDSALRARILDLLNEEYSLQKIKTNGIYVPYSDWEELSGIRELRLTSTTSRAIENVSTLELQFHARAIFSLRGTYIHESDQDFPDLSTKDIELEVELTGLADALSANEVGSVRKLQALNIGPDPMWPEQ